jgi:hypothetical protein
VIGVLRGFGKTSFVVPGDLEFRAPRGNIELVSGKSVKMKSPVVGIAARRLDIAAKSVFEKFEAATRWVREVFQLRTGRLRTRVESTYDLKAERILERAEGDVKIDGNKIHLG